MNNGQLASILVVVLGVMLFILLTLIGILVFLKYRQVKSEKNIPSNNDKKENKNDKKKSKIQESYNIQSVFDFMEFDKIEDNMILQKNGKRFLMIIKCQGINYDLMSGVEKTSVEQGFIQYLNTLRSPIQIYVQTRTVDLTGSISTYKEKVKELGDNYAQKEFEYNQKVRSGEYSQMELEKEKFEMAKARNLYEYGMDIVSNTERMSLNRNILSKQYYIILSYYPDEANDGIFSKDEVRNIAFSELYTRCQSTISLLSVCGINGKILDSIELADLLYTAYNRDEAEMYDLKKAINSGYDNIYVTAPDVLDKRIKELDRQMEIDAIEKANEAVYKVKNEQEKRLKKKEEEYERNVIARALEILEENKQLIGRELKEQAEEEIKKQEKNSNKEETNDSKKYKRAGRPRKTA